MYLIRITYSFYAFIYAEYNLFYYQLQKIVFEQDARAKESRRNEIRSEVNYLSIISKMYQAGEFNLVTKRNKFILGMHDGILEKGHLYLRKDLLLEKLKNHYRSATAREIIKFLKTNDALVEGADSTATQLYGAGNGCRFLDIPLDALNYNMKDFQKKEFY